MRLPNSSRYDGKPLLRLLEYYVLRAISQLPKEDEVKLKEMAPKLVQVYRHEGEWYEIIAYVMDLPENMAVLINEMWQRNQEIARFKNIELTPQQFAEMFVDQNLS